MPEYATVWRVSWSARKLHMVVPDDQELVMSIECIYLWTESTAIRKLESVKMQYLTIFDTFSRIKLQNFIHTLRAGVCSANLDL